MPWGPTTAPSSTRPAGTLRSSTCPSSAPARSRRPARHAVYAQDFADAVALWHQGQRVVQILGADAQVIDVAIAGPPTMRAREALADLPIDRSRGGLASAPAMIRR